MVIPAYVDLKKWSASLIVDFPFDNIPILTDNDKWKEWANVVISEPTFAGNGAPSANNYNDWRKWAFDVYLTVGVNN